MNDIEKRFNATPEVEPGIEDLEAIERIEKANDTSKGISLEQMREIRASQKYNGKISLRVPKTLHKDLVVNAKDEGISLNQYILYKLAK